MKKRSLVCIILAALTVVLLIAGCGVDSSSDGNSGSDGGAKSSAYVDKAVLGCWTTTLDRQKVAVELYSNGTFLFCMTDKYYDDPETITCTYVTSEKDKTIYVLDGSAQYTIADGSAIVTWDDEKYVFDKYDGTIFDYMRANGIIVSEGNGGYGYEVEYTEAVSTRYRYYETTASYDDYYYYHDYEYEAATGEATEDPSEAADDDYYYYYNY